jgi:small redox-active disulfide protein 2
MKKIQILGSGCAKCNLLTEETIKALKESGIEYELEKVTDFQAIMGYGVMTTPALVVDGKVAFSGKVLKAEAIKEYIQ